MVFTFDDYIVELKAALTRALGTSSNKASNLPTIVVTVFINLLVADGFLERDEDKVKIK